MLVFSGNHHFHFNAEFHPLPFHPVLGYIMAVVAVKNITKGSEVRDLTNLIIFILTSYFKRFSVTMDTILMLIKEMAFFLTN